MVWAIIRHPGRNVNYKHHYDNVISHRLLYHTYRGGNVVADRIKALRERDGYTQAELARLLGITRSSVNAWELGISVPSTQYVVELASIFKVSTDYLLCVDATATVSVAGLSDGDLQLIHAIIERLKSGG